MVIYHDLACCWCDAVGMNVSLLFCWHGFYMDFFRIKKMRRTPEHGFQPNILQPNNGYEFEYVRSSY